MAEDTADEVDGGEAGENEGEAKKGGLNKMILFIGLPAVIVILAGVAGALLFLGGGDEEVHADAAGEYGEAGEPAEPELTRAERLAAMHAWPSGGATATIDVNIEADDGRLLVMQIGFVFMYEDSNLDSILAQDVVQQRLTTTFMEFLRTLRAEDIYGSQGTFRIRAELRRRANLELAPYEIDDVLIPELIIA